MWAQASPQLYVWPLDIRPDAMNTFFLVVFTCVFWSLGQASTHGTDQVSVSLLYCTVPQGDNIDALIGVKHVFRFAPY